MARSLPYKTRNPALIAEYACRIARRDARLSLGVLASILAESLGAIGAFYESFAIASTGGIDGRLALDRDKGHGPAPLTGTLPGETRGITGQENAGMQSREEEEEEEAFAYSNFVK